MREKILEAAFLKLFLIILWNIKNVRDFFIIKVILKGFLIIGFDLNQFML